MSDHIQTIKTFHDCRNFGTRDNLLNAQQEIAAAYRSLSVEECQTLVEFVIKIREKDILSHLACLQPGSLAGHHLELVNCSLIYPPEILHGADEQAIAVLIRQLEDGTAENVNMSLLALAWGDHPAVVDAFRRWRSTPLSWSKSLHLSPDEYADSAGWELTEDGKRRGLILERCFPLVSPDHPDALPGIVGINLPSDSSCHWCGRRLTAVFDFDLTSDMLAFLEISRTRLRVETCDVCTCYGFIFTNVDWNGGSSWHPTNERPA